LAGNVIQSLGSEDLSKRTGGSGIAVGADNGAGVEVEMDQLDIQ
jgi:hypothetical protein